MKNIKVYFRLFFEQLFSSPRCLLCQLSSQREIPLCQGCEADLPWLNRHCQHCAEPLPEALSPSHSPDLTCGRCLKSPPAFSHTLAPLRYEFPVDLLIRRFKHRAERHSVELLSRLFVQRLQQFQLDSPLPQQLIPVPLHRNRLYQRGFNQSLELAESIGQRLDIRVNNRACSRLLNTPHQQGLSAKQRRRNLRHAFAVDRTQLGRVGPCLHIALIDDVMTTGTTAQALALTFRQAGVEQVDIWCLARTPPGRLTPKTD
ncbi:MAG: ComF family protein [Halopseudomonas sp.]